MNWVVEKEFPAYAERVLPWLERDPIRNSVPATLMLLRQQGAVPVEEKVLWLAWLAGPAGDVSGAAMKVTDRGVVLSTLPPGAGRALAAVAEPGWAGVFGFTAESAEFAQAYAAATGATARPVLTQHLYELGELTPPTGVPGGLTRATEADVDLCERWYQEFGAETGQPMQTDSAAGTRRLVSQGRHYLWRVDGTPVCMAGHNPSVAGATRIGPVWTPREHRRHGYAGAATAALAARLRPDRVLLSADDANPTAVGIYTRLGFRPLGEWTNWSLEY
jgi:predicted GNAT family acetyltransferase